MNAAATTLCLPGNKKSRRFPVSRLSLSAAMTILLLFHLIGYRPRRNCSAILGRSPKYGYGRINDRNGELVNF
ncbi:MAG: hypothetical protein LBB61_08250 [Treponema sp.]|nr:hypothetical protein [Treponema sp.]